MTPTKNRHNRSCEYSRWYHFELDFRRAVRRVPVHQRPSLRTWLRLYRRHRPRIFLELDPVTGEWRCI